MTNIKLLSYTITGPGIVPTSSGNTSTHQLEIIISSILGILTIVGVIYFIIQMIFAGYAFISSQGDKEKLKSARNRITNGILGLTVVVIAFGVGAFLAKLAGIDPKTIFNLNTFFTSIGR